MIFFLFNWDILISSFQKIPWPSSTYPPWKTLQVQNCRNMENTLKIKVFWMLILFCKYLHNESLDLHEILFGDQLLFCELKLYISQRFVHKCACTSCKRAHARFIKSARVYHSCARIYAEIFMKFEILAHKIIIDCHIKFHEDRSFCCGDICKTILVFFNRWFSMYFPYFLNYAPQKSSEMDNYWIIMNSLEYIWHSPV